MTFLDHQTDEHAFDALDRIGTVPDQLKPFVAMGCMHAGLAVLADHMGHGITTEALRDLQRQLDHWRDTDQIDG